MPRAQQVKELATKPDLSSIQKQQRERIGLKQLSSDLKMCIIANAETIMHACAHPYTYNIHAKKWMVPEDFWPSYSYIHTGIPTHSCTHRIHAHRE